MYFAFRGVDIEKMMQSIWSANYFWIFISMGMGFLAFVSRGLRWVLLIKSMGYEVSPFNCIWSVTVGYFSNLALPRIGEVTRCTSLNQVENIPVNKLFGTIILERTIDFAMLLMLIGFSFALQYEQIGVFFEQVLGAKEGASSIIVWMALAVGLFFLLLLYIFREKIRRFSFYSKVIGFLIGLKEGFQSISNMPNKALFWLHTFFIWFMYFAMTYVCVFAIPETSHLGWGAGLLLMVVGGLGMVVPASGGIGSYHYAIMLGMSALGVSIESGVGLTYATIVHAGQTIMILVTGGLAVLLLYLARRKKARHEAIANPGI